MKCEELCECFNLPNSMIDELESAGLLGEGTSGVSGRDFTEEDVQYLNRVLTLKNAGIEIPFIKELLGMEDDEEHIQQRLKILIEQRKKQMIHLHLTQKMIDRLDFLINDLKNHKNR